MQKPWLQRTLPILALVLFMPLLAYAESKVIVADGTYTMGDGETPFFAEAMVLQKAKRTALEEAGIYVESYTRVQNFNLTKEEIQTLAGGVLQVVVLESNRTLVGDGLRFYTKIKATVTTDKIEELAGRIKKDKNVAEEYKKLQEEYTRLTKEIETWKNLIAKASAGPAREIALGEIRVRQKAFELVHEQEDALFTHLGSGQDLVAIAENHQDLVARLARKLMEEGHLVSIGKPESHLRADNKISLQVTVAVQGNEVLIPFAQEASNKLGGGRLKDVTGTLSPERRRSLFGSARRRFVIGKLTGDRQVTAELLKKLNQIEVKFYDALKILETRDLQPPFFNLKFVLDEGIEIFPCAYWASHGPRPRRMFGFSENENGEATFVIQLDPVRYKVSLEMPASLVKPLRSISARYEEEDRSLIEFVNYLQDFLTGEERKKLGLDHDGVASPLTNIRDLHVRLPFLVDHPEFPLDLTAFVKEGLTPADRELLTRLLVILDDRRKEFGIFLKEKIPACTSSEEDSP